MIRTICLQRCTVAAAFAASLLAFAHTSTATNSIVPIGPLPYTGPFSGWECPFAQNTTDASNFAPPNVYTTGVFSLSGVPDYRPYGYADDINVIATTIALLMRNYTYYQGQQGYVDSDFPASGTWTSTILAKQMADVNYNAGFNAGGGSAGASDHLYNGLALSRLFYLTCKGSGPQGLDAIFYSANAYMPLISDGDLTSRITNGMVGVMQTNVETWDGAAWTYGATHYYNVIGSTGTSFKLFEPATQSAVWRTFAWTSLNQRWSNGSIAYNKVETVVSSTASTREVVTTLYGLDAIW